MFAMTCTKPESLARALLCFIVTTLAAIYQAPGRRIQATKIFEIAYKGGRGLISRICKLEIENHKLGNRFHLLMLSLGV